MVNRSVKSRKEPFVEKASTNIWQEQSAPDNPYLVEKTHLRGYDFDELTQHCDFTEMFYLLFLGELPNRNQKQLLQLLLVTFISPSPRHPASRSAMSLGGGKTFPQHILPASLGIAGGEYLGGRQVQLCMQLIQDNHQIIPALWLEEQQARLAVADKALLAEGRIIYGFGQQYGEIDPYASLLADKFLGKSFSGPHLTWCAGLVEELKPYYIGWLQTGIVAAVLCDLGFPPHAGAGLFQLIQAPGLLAHGLEAYPKSRTEFPFVRDEDYDIVDT